MMATEPTTARGIHYGWVITVCALIALLVSNGMTLAGLTVWDEALLNEFGWSRGELKFRDTITFVVAGLLGPFAGGFADRYGVRKLMTLGALLLSTGFFMYSRITEIWHVYAIHFVFGMALATVGLVVNVLLVSRWFTLKRGTAIGIALVGTSLGNSVFPPLNTFFLSLGDWRAAFTWVAVVPLALLPIIFLFIRDWPRDKGIAPYGGVAAPAAGPPPGMEYRDAIRTRNFWALALTATATFYAILALASHLFLHLRGQGFSPETAAAGVGTLFLLGLFGKFLLGAAADYFDRKRVFIGNLFVMFLGTALFVVMTPATLWPAVVLVGLGWGGLYTLLQLLVVESFGLRAAGKILGTITVMDAIGGGLGIWLTGVIFDRTGSYQPAFAVIAGLVFLALISAAMVRRPDANAGFGAPAPATPLAAAKP